MTLSTLLLAVFLILFGISNLGWVAVSAFALGLVAFITGIIFLVEAFTPLTVWKR